MLSGPKTPVPTRSLVSSPESRFLQRPPRRARWAQQLTPGSARRLRQLPPPACSGHSLDNSSGAHPVQRKSCPLHLQNITRIRLFRPLSLCKLYVNLPAPPHSHFPCHFFFNPKGLLISVSSTCSLCVFFLFCLIPLKCKLDDVRDFCSQVYSCRVVLFSANSGHSPM